MTKYPYSYEALVGEHPCHVQEFQDPIAINPRKIRKHWYQKEPKVGVLKRNGAEHINIYIWDLEIQDNTLTVHFISLSGHFGNLIGSWGNWCGASQGNRGSVTNWSHYIKIKSKDPSKLRELGRDPCKPRSALMSTT